MAGRRKHEYPPDEEIIEGCRTVGNFEGYARTLGIAGATLRHHCKGQGILEQCHEATRSPLTATEPVAVDAPVSREEILEQENADLRRALNKARSGEVKFERVIASIETYLPVARPTGWKTRPLRRDREQKTAHTLGLLWSDQHAAEVVSLEETNGINEYNWEIMLQRHEELRRGIASWADRFAPVEELVVAGLGDGLSGNIHEELAETNEMPLAEAAVQWGVDGAKWLESLLEIVPRIRFAGVVGNHPRAHKKPRAKHKHDNADWVAYQVMRQTLSREPRITFEIPKGGRHLIEIYGRRILLMHGDAVPPSAMVGVPWGGVIRLEARMRNQYAAQGTPIDHLWLGHFHEPNVLSNRRIAVNGSVKGADEYGLDRYGEAATPAQLLIPFHPRHGMVGGQYIDLDVDAQADVRTLRAA